MQSVDPGNCPPGAARPGAADDGDARGPADGDGVQVLLHGARQPLCQPGHVVLRGQGTEGQLTQFSFVSFLLNFNIYLQRSKGKGGGNEAGNHFYTEKMLLTPIGPNVIL